MIELKNISKHYRHNGDKITALDSIDLEVNRGEIVGVIGKSGAGKSSLIRCVNLLERPDQGEVWVNQQDLMTLNHADLRAARKQIGMIFQHFNLLHSKTAFENIALPLSLQDLDQATVQQRVSALLDLIGLSDKAQQYPSQLSGGQKQRIAIARALATEPTVLLCDEITSALDPENTFSILQLLRKIQRQHNIAILLITHDMNVIKTVADRAIVLDQGQIVEQDDILNIFKNPKTAIAQSLTQASLHCELPQTLQQQLQSSPLDHGQAMIRVKFLGHPAVEPIIDQLIRQHQVKVNIFQANLEYIQQETIGMMILSAQGSADNIAKAIAFLNTQHCNTDILGYSHATIE